MLQTPKSRVLLLPFQVMMWGGLAGESEIRHWTEHSFSSVHIQFYYGYFQLLNLS